MQTQDTPLDALVVDSQKADLHRLASILKGQIQIDPDRDRVQFAPGAQRGLTIRQQVMFYLLGRKALDIKLGRGEPTTIAPAALGEALGIKGGSLRPQIKQLADDGFIFKEDGGYYVRSNNLDFVADLLEVSDVH